MKSFFLTPILIFLTLAISCDTIRAQTAIFLHQGQTASLVEFPSQALPIWAGQQQTRPTLILFSRDPLLQQQPATLKESTAQLLRHPESGDLASRLSPLTASPLLLPRMTLRSALEAQLFSSVIWVFPLRADAEQLDLELFRRQLLESAAASPEEAQSFLQQQAGFSGTIANTPVRAVPMEQLEKVAGTTLLHIDLSYFAPYYQGEIKTPLYPLLYSFLERLKSLELNTSALTISFSNLDGNLPLATRFIGATLAQLAAAPQQLTQPLPEVWELRRKALYLGNFFQSEKIYQLYRQILTSTPDDASIHYALYQVLRQLKRGTEALTALAEATRLDPAYGYEYLRLVTTALEMGQPDEALEMFALAEATFPQSPLISLQKMQLLLDLGRPEQAAPLLKKLALENWSEIYYPEIKQELEAETTANRN